MAIVNRTPAEVEADLVSFARKHGLMLVNSTCLKSHIERFLSVGHCPCVETRYACPCQEALSDAEEMGRCQCGILIDPVRLSMMKHHREGG